jgi:hypothetical protein
VRFCEREPPGGPVFRVDELNSSPDGRTELELVELDAASSCEEALQAICEVATRGSNIVRQRDRDSFGSGSSGHQRQCRTTTADCDEPYYKRIGCHRRQGWSDSGDHKSAGHGLGLAVVQGIVRSIGGAIDLASEPDKGTTAPATDRRPCHLSVAPFWSWKMRISAPGCCEDAP